MSGGPTARCEHCAWHTSGADQQTTVGRGHAHHVETGHEVEVAPVRHEPLDPLRG